MYWLVRSSVCVGVCARISGRSCGYNNTAIFVDVCVSSVIENE